MKAERKTERKREKKVCLIMNEVREKHHVVLLQKVLLPLACTGLHNESSSRFTDKAPPSK